MQPEESSFAHLIHLLTCVSAICACLRTLLIWMRTGNGPELATAASALALAFGGAGFTVIGASCEPSGESPQRTLPRSGSWLC